MQTEDSPWCLQQRAPPLSPLPHLMTIPTLLTVSLPPDSLLCFLVHVYLRCYASSLPPSSTVTGWPLCFAEVALHDWLCAHRFADDNLDIPAGYVNTKSDMNIQSLNIHIVRSRHVACIRTATRHHHPPIGQCFHASRPTHAAGRGMMLRRRPPGDAGDLKSPSELR